jgi:nucleoside-diphosphate-sugar epimerase
MSLRLFLTGAGGYLGGVLIERLARLPEVESVTGIGLTPPKAPLPPKVTFRQMDIRSADLAAAMAGHDVVIHTAGVVLWPAKMPARERDDTNLNGVRNVAKAALANQVHRFIHTSSMAAYDPGLARGRTGVDEDFPIGNGDSPFYYWNNKALGEKTLTGLFAASGTLLTLLRPIYIMGPRNRAVTRSYRRNAVNLRGYNPRRQFVHEADVAAAFIQALRTDMPGPYNVVPDDWVRLDDVWRIVGVKAAPTVPLWLAVTIVYLRWRWLGSPVHPSWVRDMLVDFTGNNARLKAAGWRPQFGSEAALRAAL